MSKRYITLVVSLMFILSAGGCASLFSVGKQSVKFDSNPQDALVYIEAVNGSASHRSSTPFTTQLKKKYDYEITVEMAGYVSKSFNLERINNNWLIGDFAKGIMPWVVFENHNLIKMDLEPDEIKITLEKSERDKNDNELLLVVYTISESGELIKNATPMDRSPKVTI